MSIPPGVVPGPRGGAVFPSASRATPPHRGTRTVTGHGRTGRTGGATGGTGPAGRGQPAPTGLPRGGPGGGGWAARPRRARSTPTPPPTPSPGTPPAPAPP